MSQTKEEEIKAQVTSILKEVEANPLQLQIVIQRLCEENASMKDQLAITKQKLQVFEQARAEIKDPEDRRRATAELWNAVMKGEDVRTVEAAVEAGADIRGRNLCGETPLHWAARSGREAAVLYLLSHGAELEAKDESGWTPLHWAARHGHLPCTKLLVERGADLNASTSDGDTPLAVAVDCCRHTVQEYLESVGGSW